MSSDCICSRQKSALYCMKCKSYAFGRIMRDCPIHKNVFYLMDTTYCANCHAPSSSSMLEMDMSYELVQKINADKKTKRHTY